MHPAEKRQSSQPPIIEPTVGITFSPDVYASLQQVSSEQKISVSQVVNGMCALWLRE